MNTTKNRRPSFPRTGTSAAREYYRSYSEIERLFDWILHMAGSSDHVAKTATKALHRAQALDKSSKENNDQALKERLEHIEKKGMLSELVRQRQILLEVILARQVENFLNYLSRLLAEVFVSRPETLSTDQSVKLKDIVTHKRMNDFIQAEAARRVNQLSYKSFNELNQFFRDRFNTQIAESDHEIRIIEAIETRNISVHNRGIVNRIYKDKTNNNEFKIGKKREIYSDEYSELSQAMLETVILLDKKMRNKMQLKGVNFRIQDLKSIGN